MTAVLVTVITTLMAIITQYKKDFTVAFIWEHQNTSYISITSHPNFTDKKIRMFQSEITEVMKLLKLTISQQN